MIYFYFLLLYAWMCQIVCTKAIPLSICQNPSFVIVYDSDLAPSQIWKHGVFSRYRYKHNYYLIHIEWLSDHSPLLLHAQVIPLNISFFYTSAILKPSFHAVRRYLYMQVQRPVLSNGDIIRVWFICLASKGVWVIEHQDKKNVQISNQWRCLDEYYGLTYILQG